MMSAVTPPSYVTLHILLDHKTQQSKDHLAAKEHTYSSAMALLK